MYNEASRIPGTLHSLSKYLNSNQNLYIDNYEIVLVDDGSVDGTVSTIESINSDNVLKINTKIVKHDKNYGKGRAVKTGVLNSNMDYILYVDSDNSVDISNIELFANYIDNFDLIIGSRKLNYNNNIRYFISFAGHILNKTLITKVYDTQCPFKLIKSDIAKNLFKKITIDKFAFDLELLFLAQKNNFLIKEVPVDYKIVPGSKFNVVKDLYKTLLDFIKIHINIFYGIYR